MILFVAIYYLKYRKVSGMAGHFPYVLDVRVLLINYGHNNLVFKHSDLENTLHYGEFYAVPIITQVKILHHPMLANPGQLGVYSVPGIWEIIN